MQALDLVELAGQHFGQRRAFARPRLTQPRQRRIEALQQRRVAVRLLGRIGRILGRFQHAAQGEQTVEARPAQLGALLQFRRKRQDLAQQRLVDDIALGARGAAHVEAGVDVAAAEAGAEPLADVVFEMLQPRRHAQPDVEALAVDAPELPGPGERALRTLGTGISGHAGDAQGRRPAAGDRGS
jgi:hypothetical protein